MSNTPIEITNREAKTGDSIVLLSDGEGEGEEDDLEVLAVKRSSRSTMTTKSSPAREKLRDVVDLTKDSPRHPPQTAATALPPRNVAHSSLKCNVCLETISQPTSTICGHLFCETCIRLVVRQTGACPTCRRKLNGRQIHRVYL